MQNSVITKMVEEKVTKYSMVLLMTNEEAKQRAVSKNEILVSKHVTTLFK